MQLKRKPGLYLFLEAIASLVVTFSLTHSVSNSVRFLLVKPISSTYQPKANSILSQCHYHFSHMSVQCLTLVSCISKPYDSYISMMAATCKDHVNNMSDQYHPHVIIIQPYLYLNGFQIQASKCTLYMSILTNPPSKTVLS